MRLPIPERQHCSSVLEILSLRLIYYVTCMKNLSTMYQHLPVTRIALTEFTNDQYSQCHCILTWHFSVLPMRLPIPKHELQRQSYSSDLRERVIYLRYSLNCHIREVSYLLNMSQRVEERTLKQWRDTGKVMPPGSGRSGKRARLLDQEEIEVCIEFYKK